MIELSPLSVDDFELASGWLSDPDINTWLNSAMRGKDINPRILAMLVRSSSNALYLVRHDGDACGLVGFSDIDEGDRIANVWYLLGDVSKAGKGVTTSAVTAGLTVAKDELELHAVYAWIIEDNVPSRRVLEKVGFREMGRMRSATLSSGRRVDRVYFDFVL